MRSRLAAVGYALYVLACPTLLVLTVRFGSLRLAQLVAVVAALQIAALPWELAFVVVAVVGSKRVPLMDRLPAEAYASLVAVPIGTTAGATAGSLALDIERTGAGWATFALLVGLALLMSVGIPLAMAYRVTIERGGRSLALWDDAATVTSRLYTAQRWWSNHVAARRWVLAGHRRAWLGAIDDEPAAAWPTAWRRSRLLLFSRLVVWGPLAVAAVVAAAAAPFLLSVRGAGLLSLSYVAAPAAMTSCTLLLRVYRLTLEEQVEAGRIRERYLTLREALTERAAPEEPVRPRSRWRRAWDELCRPA